MKNRKGQQALIGLIYGIILVMIFCVMLPVLLTFIQVGVNNSVGAPNASIIQTVLNSIPVFAALVILLAFVILIIGR